MGKLTKLAIAGVIAGATTLGGITVASSANAGTGSDLGCYYWWDSNTLGVKCNTDFMAHATCNDGTFLTTTPRGAWIPAGRQIYLYCSGHRGYRAGSGGAVSK